MLEALSLSYTDREVIYRIRLGLECWLETKTLAYFASVIYYEKTSIT
jgi:hypothetical protein